MATPMSGKNWFLFADAWTWTVGNLIILPRSIKGSSPVREKSFSQNGLLGGLLPGTGWGWDIFNNAPNTPFCPVLMVTSYYLPAACPAFR